ncbi:MAG TPA: hypothetical protein DDZ80_00785, partial [Cyanobacteria bacterium UBA8803]|nr:hypothetical protein [Cyanobacteria bacterium UBA8803]
MNNFINSSLKGNILVVDDTPANLNLLKRILSEQGYKVRCARNGQLALKAAQFSPPDLILLDILMPEMDGYQICSQLKADERTKDVPIIFISALHETFEKVKAFEAGGVDYITKPFQVKEVLARVENHLRLSQLSKQLLEQNARLVQEIEERKKAEEALRQSEERYGAIVEAQTEAIARFNPEGKLTFVNEAYCRYFGLSQYELIGNHFQSLVFSEDLAKIEQLLNSLSWDNPVREIEHRLVVRGEVRWMQWSIQAIFDRAGSLLEFQSVGRDISDRKKTEEHLQLLERAIAASNNGIMICDALVPERPIIYTNSGFERITGYKKEEVLGKNCRFLQGNDKNQPALKELRHAIAKARETQVILRNYRKDGTLFWNQFCLTPVRDDTGRLTHFIGVQTDITKRQQQEEALRLIVEGTAAATGEEFFRCCTRYLAQVLKVRYAFVTQLVKGSTSRVRTLAFWTGSDFGENIESELPGTPCQQVILGATAYYPQDVQETFPEAQHLVEFGVQSYLGIPLIDAAGNIMGHLAVMDISPLENDPDKELILRIFAARAGAELERQRAEEEIRFLLSATSAIAQADDFNCALSLMLHSCCEFIGWDLAEAWIPNGDGSLLEYFSGGLTSDLNDSSWCAYDPSLQGFRLQSFKITFVPGVGLPGRIWSSQQPEWIEDVSIQSSLLFKRHEIAVLMGLKACFGIPILLNNRVLAVLVFFKKAAIPAQPHLVELVQGVVAQAALLIQRKRTEEKLRTSEAKFREKATELEVTVEKLKRTQTHVIQAEKMSGLGKMVAGVAHEI